MKFTDTLTLFATHFVCYWGNVLVTSCIYKNQFRGFAACAQRVLVNQLFWTPLAFAPLLYLCPVSTHPFWHVVYQLPLCICLTDVIFYHLHRLMHHRTFYAYHKDHHLWNIPIGASALYSGAFEHVVVNALPPILAGILAQCNPTVLQLWIGIASANTVLAHAKSPGDHISHHERHQCNYGVGLYLCDRLYGTYVSPTSPTCLQR